MLRQPDDMRILSAGCGQVKIKLPEEISGDGFLLRKPRKEDAPHLMRAMQDELTARSLDIKGPYTLRRAEDAIAREDAKRALSGTYTWAIDEGGVFAGEVSLTMYEEDLRAETGYFLVPEARGRGLGQKAVRTAIDAAFRAAPLNRIYAMHTGDNEASAKVLESVGMKREGVLRRHRIKHGVPVDIVYWGILREEWEKTYGGGK